MKRIIAGFLALLMLTISLKVGVAIHYCGGNLAQTKIVVGYGKATCGMEGKNKAGDNCPSGSIRHSHCCQNLISQIKTDNFRSTLIALNHLAGFAFSIVFWKDLLTARIDEFKNQRIYFPPPELTSVSLTFIKVFLI